MATVADVREIKRRCLELMETAADLYFATVDSTVDNGFPFIRCMFNWRCASRFPSLVPLFRGHGEDLLVYLGANTSSVKVRQLRGNGRAAVYYCQPERFRGLLLQGVVESVDDAAFKKTVWQPGWEMYYPQGPADPDFAVLRLVPVRARGWWEGGPFDITI